MKIRAADGRGCDGFHEVSDTAAIKPDAVPVGVTWVVHDDWVVPEPEPDDVGAGVDGVGWVGAADDAAVDGAEAVGEPAAIAAGAAGEGCDDGACGDVAGATAVTVVGEAAAAVTVVGETVGAPCAAGSVATGVVEGLAALPDVGFAELAVGGAATALNAGSEFGGSTGNASQNHPMICIPGQLSVPLWAS